MNEGFSIGYQVTKELEEFQSARVQLAAPTTDQNFNDIRYLSSNPAGYYFNQMETVSIIDMYWNSRFMSGEKDENGQRKIFMNIGKFRSEVASKQVDIDTKDFRFIPDEYANPWVAIFLQKEFKEWARQTNFAKLVEGVIDDLPKYGSVVMKKMPAKVGEKLPYYLDLVPIQNFIIEQTADCIEEAAYKMEKHPAMHMWELQEMKAWNLEGLNLEYDETVDVYERYGYVPQAWINKYNNLPYTEDEWNTYVCALTITAKRPAAKDGKKQHIFFAQEISEDDVPYREVHWSKQHGRWLGIGVMEDLIQNQEAKNIIINLYRQSLQWSAKRLSQTQSNDLIGKNLVRDAKNGDILEVGAQGEIKPIDLTNHSMGEFQEFMASWEENSNQKSFTYDIVTGALAARTPYRLAILLANAVASYYAKKKKIIGLFFQEVVEDFLLPTFYKDMGKTDRILNMFSGESGFEVLKAGALSFIQQQAAHASLLSGKLVDASMLEQLVGPYAEMKTWVFTMAKEYYQDVNMSFTFTVTEENVDLRDKVQNLTALYQALAAQGDPRAEKVLEKLASYEGVNMDDFGAGAPSQMGPGNAPAPDNSQPSAGAPGMAPGKFKGSPVPSQPQGAMIKRGDPYPQANA